jgi:N-acylglucosamine 2-epimerase
MKSYSSSELFDKDRHAELLNSYRDGLLNNVLPFWIQYAIDRECGGYLTGLDFDGTIVDTDKGLWQQARFAWLLGELSRADLIRELGSEFASRQAEWLEIAGHGMRFLDRYGYDSVDGRLWFQLTRQGVPLRKRRYVFSEAFASIAYGELAAATGNAEYARKARETFARFIDHNLHPPADAAKFTTTRPTRGLGFPMITINVAQQLRESIQLEEASAWIDRSIAAIRQFHVKSEINAVMEVVGPQGELLNTFDGRTLNPGHAIEAAWFIMAEGGWRQDQDLIDLGCQMLDGMWQRGWDQRYGGMLYFVSVDERPIQEYWHDMKFWWPHNETIIATLLAYVLTGDNKYAQWHALVHDWSHQHFACREHGEWFGYLHRDGSVSSTLKGNLWKGPFHLPRMQWTCWQILAGRFFGLRRKASS